MMQVYLKLIARTVNANPAISSLEVWKALCESFSFNQSHSLFRQSLNNHMFLVSYFNSAGSQQWNSVNFLQRKLNDYFNSAPLDLASPFGEMLKAFLICYPEFLVGLHEDIIHMLAIRPYHLTFQVDDIEAITSASKDEHEFGQKLCLMLYQVKHFSQTFIEKMLLQLTELFTNDHYFFPWSEKALVTLVDVNPDLDLTFMLDVMLTKNTRAYWNIRSYILKIITHPSFDLPHYLKELTQKFATASNEEKEFTIHILDDLTDGTNHYYPIILIALRTLLSDPDFCLNCKMLKVLCVVSDNDAELTAKLPALFEQLKNGEVEVKRRTIDIIEAICLKVPTNISVVIAELNARLLDFESEAPGKAADALKNLSCNIEADFSVCVQNLVPILATKEYDLRSMEVAWSLGQIVISNTPEIPLADVMPALLAVLNDPDTNDELDRESVAMLIGEIALHRIFDYEEAISVLISKLQNPGTRSYESLAYLVALGKIAKRPETDLTTILPLLVNSIVQENSDITDHVVNALLGICENKDNIPLVVSELLKTLQTFHWSWLWRTLDILDKIVGPPLPIDFNYWVNFIRVKTSDCDCDKEIVFDNLRLLCEKPEVNTETVILALLVSLHDTDEDARASAIHALTNVNKCFAVETYLVIIAALKNCVNDWSDDVQKAALRGLGQLCKRIVMITIRGETKAVSNEDYDDELVPEEKEDEQTGNKRKHMEFYGRRGRGGGRSHSFKRAKIINESTSEEDKSSPPEVSTVVVDAAIAVLLEVVENKPALKSEALYHLQDIPQCSQASRKLIESAFIASLQASLADGYTSAALTLAKIAALPGADLDAILPALVNALASKHSRVRVDSTKAIEFITNSLLDAHQLNYLHYGLLLHKLYDSQDQPTRFALLETIERMSRLRELDFELASCLPVMGLVTHVKAYISQPMSCPR